MTTKIPISLELLTSDYARNQSTQAMQLRDKDPNAYLESYPQLMQKIAPSAVEDYVKNNNDHHSTIQFHNRLVHAKNKPSPLAEVKGKAAKKAAKRQLQAKHNG
jgi:hypothetical protein